MILVITRLNRREGDAPENNVLGWAPDPDCPLCVLNVWKFNFERKEWERDPTRYCITHRATGYNLGDCEWSTREEALAVLMRCDPSFPAWPLATGAEGEAATLACKAKFRWATESTDDA